MNNTLTALNGVMVGHSTHRDKLTGCTVVLLDDFCPVAYKSYGGAPGTFNTENLKNGKSWPARRCLFIAGGSFGGFEAATGIMEFMIENKMGHVDGDTIVPPISGAIIYDLGVSMAQYTTAYGLEAAQNASRKPVEGGNVGAGTGASVGKFSLTNKGLLLAMKAGVGSARIDLGNGATICALSIVNALGNVVLQDGTILAGNRDDTKTSRFRTFETASNLITGKPQNTTVSIVGTNVDLGEYSNYEKVAQIASHGQIKAISPVNTSLDGDTVFVFSTKEVKSFFSPLGKYIVEGGWPNLPVDVVGHAAANAVMESIYDACRQAETIPYDMAFQKKIPCCKDLL